MQALNKDEDHNGRIDPGSGYRSGPKAEIGLSGFKSITPVEQGGRWVFEYLTSPRERVEGYRVENKQDQTGKKEKYHRNMSERRKTLLRDAKDLLVSWIKQREIS